MFLEPSLPPLEDHLAEAGLLVKRADLSPLPDGQPQTVETVAHAVERTWECATRDQWKLLSAGMPWLVAVTCKADPTAAGVVKGLERMREDVPPVIVLNTGHLTRHLLYRRIYEQSGARRARVTIAYPARHARLLMEPPIPLTPAGKTAIKWWLTVGRQLHTEAVWWNAG
jgi:hypothetical protein